MAKWERGVEGRRTKEGPFPERAAEWDAYAKRAIPELRERGRAARLVAAILLLADGGSAVEEEKNGPENSFNEKKIASDNSASST